jgi:iron complex transport system substrate-binding protein
MPKKQRARCTTRPACGWAFPTISKKPKRRADLARAAGTLLLAALFPGGCGPRPRPDPASAAPARIVTLAPNLTEIVFALGAGGRLVGVSEHSDHPEAARAIPRVGGLEVSAERVTSLRPDLVLATREGNTSGPVSALQSAGVPVLVVPAGSLDDVLAGIRLVAGRLGREDAGEALLAALDRHRRAARALAAAGPRPRAILLIWPEPPQAAGGGTFLHDVLTEAGAENVLADRPGWPLVSPEYLAATPVDVIVVPESEQNRAVYERALREGVLSRGAAKRSRIVRVDESAMTRPGPRVFEALEELARALRDVSREP